MPAIVAASELAAPPLVGRVFSGHRQVRLGDVDDRARLCLDAIARYLQDVATDDTADADLDAGGSAPSWVVRRTMIDIERAAGLDEELELARSVQALDAAGPSGAPRSVATVGRRSRR